MEPINAAKIQEVIREFFDKAGLPVDAVEVKSPQDSTIPINLRAGEPQILIGEGGQTLLDIQRLLKLVIKKRFPPEAPFYIDLDVNDYKKKKIEYLKETARSAADEVFLTRKEKMLPIMTAYDRRVIHVELANRTDVIAESVGEEPDRKIIVRAKV